MKSTIFIFWSLVFCGLIMHATAQVSSIIENFDATTGSDLPLGWAGSAVAGTNFGTGNFYADHTTGSARFAFGSNGYIASPLVAAGNYNLGFWMRISSLPSENLQIGYCTSQSDIPGTFVLIQTLNNSTTTWTLTSVFLMLPVDCYITWSCAGTSKTHCIDDINLGLLNSIGDKTGSGSDFSFSYFSSNDLLNINCNKANAGQYCFSVYDLAGRNIITYAYGFHGGGKLSTTLSFQGIRSGLYLIAVIRDGQLKKTQKISVY